jgi:hypothetical protein
MSTVPQSCIGDSILRQIRVGPTWTKAWWSSVISGTDQLRWTELPLRTALRSLTGRANSSDGGSGIPGVPQLESNPTEAIPSANVSFVSFICSGKISTSSYTEYSWRRGRPHPCNLSNIGNHSLSLSSLATAARARAPAPPESNLANVSTNDSELENIPAQILILHDIGQRLADVIGVNCDLLAFSFRRGEADLI